MWSLLSAVCLCVSAYVCLCVCVSVCECVYVSLCDCMCVHVCVSVCAITCMFCTHLQLWTSSVIILTSGQSRLWDLTEWANTYTREGRPMGRECSPTW